MKLKHIRNFLTTENGLIVVSSIFILLAFSFLGWNANLNKSLEKRIEGYQSDLALSQNKQEHERIYREMISQSAVPQASYQNQNEWIQSTQALVREHGLQLKEVTPVVEEKKGKDGRVKLFLLLEGEVGQWVGFLHALANSGNPVYVESFSTALATGQEHSIRIEMMLTQF